MSRRERDRLEQMQLAAKVIDSRLNVQRLLNSARRHMDSSLKLLQQFNVVTNQKDVPESDAPLWPRPRPSNSRILG